HQRARHSMEPLLVCAFLGEEGHEELPQVTADEQQDCTGGNHWWRLCGDVSRMAPLTTTGIPYSPLLAHLPPWREVPIGPQRRWLQSRRRFPCLARLL